MSSTSADAPLPDGTYDAIVVDADEHPDGTVGIQLTVLAGPSKGQLVEVRGPARTGQDPIELLGIPATVTVSEGRPHVALEP